MTALQLPPEIQRMWMEMQVEAHEAQRRAVLSDPVKHKLTLHFPTGARMNWRYCRVDKAGWPLVRYCYSTERNLAGYFLGWRETIKRDGSGKRDMWIASKRRTTVREKAQARARAHNSRVQNKLRKSLEERRTTYWVSEEFPNAGEGELRSRGLGRVVATGGIAGALEVARTKWPDVTGELAAFHIGRRS